AREAEAPRGNKTLRTGHALSAYARRRFGGRGRRRALEMPLHVGRELSGAVTGKTVITALDHDQTCLRQPPEPLLSHGAGADPVAVAPDEQSRRGDRAER